MSTETPASGTTARSDDAPLLRLRDLKKHYDRSSGIVDDLLGAPSSVKAVDGVDLTVRDGETVAVVGESGCGKSTLGRTVLNLDKPTAGTIEYRGEDITGLSDGDMRPYRQDLQMVFQDPLASLNPRQTVRDILTAPMEVHGLPESDSTVETTAVLETEGIALEHVEVTVADDLDLLVEPVDGTATVHVRVVRDADASEASDATTDPSGEAASDADDETADDVRVETAEDVEVSYEVRDDGTVAVDVGVGSLSDVRGKLAQQLLERVGLKAAHIDRYPHQFSGGQQQRVAIARALTLEPDLLVADEPVSALDVSVQAQLLNLFEDLQDDLGLSMLFISHDLSVVRQVADRVAVMYLGELVEVAPTDELFENPQHPYTKSLLSAVPRIDPDHRTDRTILEGTVPSPADPPSGCRFHTRCPAVVPPADWSADQETFRAAFAFRSRVLAEELDPEAIRTRLESEGRATDDDAVAAYVVEHALDAPLADLPPDRASSLQDAAQALAAGDIERAKRVVGDAFPSPCERETPADTDVGPDHTAACHRIDD